MRIARPRTTQIIAYVTRWHPSLKPTGFDVGHSYDHTVAAAVVGPAFAEAGLAAALFEAED